MLLDLPPMAVADRLPKVRAALADVAADALAVLDLTNIRYLTGFTGSSALLVVTGADAVFVTDGRYTGQAADQLVEAGVEADIRITRDADAVLAAVLKGRSRLAVEADHLSWNRQRHLAASVLPWVDLIPTSGLVEGLRAVKDDGEVARLRTACRIADESLAAVRHLLDERPTEIAFRRALEAEMADRGSSAPSFETIVGSGPNGAKPHARPTDRVIGSSGDGEWVVIDFGATVDGYHSDMTRTYPVGDLSVTQQRMFDVVASAQAAGRAAVTAGVDSQAVDGACRAVIADAGWADAFSHGTGHGIGLVIHEDPRVSKESSWTLEAGHCVTVEPGVYLPEHGGVRIEDSLLVTATGHDILTRAPYT